MKSSSVFQVMVEHPLQSVGSLVCVALLAAAAFFGGDQLGLATGPRPPGWPNPIGAQARR